MKIKNISAGIFAALIITQATSCASGSPPKQQLTTTQNSIKSAEAAGAVTYASEPLRSAQKKMARAQELIGKKKYDKANHQLQLAKSDAELAEATAIAKKSTLEAQGLAASASKLQQEVRSREEKLQAQLAELNELKALQAKNTDRGMVLTLGDVLFDTGDSTLRSSAMKNLDQVTTFLQKYPDRTLQIEGHTDNVGEDSFNLSLSTERADAVRSVLQDAGINGSRIIVRGLGESIPIASNNDASGRQLNRRVELIFDHVENNVLSAIDE